MGSKEARQESGRLRYFRGVLPAGAGKKQAICHGDVNGYRIPHWLSGNRIRLVRGSPSVVENHQDRQDRGYIPGNLHIPDSGNRLLSLARSLYRICSIYYCTSGKFNYELVCVVLLN